MPKVIIASKNPVKINCTKESFERLFPEKQFHFQGVEVSSDVADQPASDDETLTGAINRANNAKYEVPEADYWVGIEGGIDQMGGELVAFAWIVITDASRTGKARTGTFELPSKVVELIKEGIELGYANDKVFGEKDSKKSGGAVGSLTQGMLSRTAYYEQAVMLALIPFINPDLYEG